MGGGFSFLLVVAYGDAFENNLAFDMLTSSHIKPSFHAEQSSTSPLLADDERLDRQDRHLPTSQVSF